MAEFRVQVVIDPAGAQRGGRQVRRELQQVERSAQRVGNAIRQALAFAGISVGIGQLVQLADTFTNIQNRLRTVTDDTRQLANVTDELFEISNRTRQRFESTAELYTRVSLASRELGLTQRDTLQFTESLNQAVILSGATAQEASAGLIQLSQGLASGALRGDELRSVLEQLPVVADVIADGLGVTRGELRALGADGVITAEVVIDAFRQAEQELREGFGETVPTIGQSLQVLRNNLIILVGGFTEASGASEFLANAILSLAENLETVLRLVAAAAIAFGLQGFAAAVGIATRAVIGLTAAIAANPLGALVVGLTAAVSLLTAFGDQILISNDGVTTFFDLLSALGQIALEAFGVLTDAARTAFDFINGAFGGFVEEGELSIRSVVTFWAGGWDLIIGAGLGALTALGAALANFPAFIEAYIVGAFNAITRRITDNINILISGINSITGLAGLEAIDLLEPFEAEATTSFTEIGENIGAAFTAGFERGDFVGDAVNAVFDRAEQIAQDRLFGQDTGTGLTADSPGLLPPGATTRTPGGTGGSGSGRESDAIRERREELERLADVLNEVRGIDEGLLQRQADLNFLFETGQISLEQFTAAMRDLNVELSALDQSFSGGIQNGIDRLIQRTNDLGSQVSDFVVGAFDQATNAIVEFAKTGEINVRELFQSIFAQLLQLATNQLISSLLGSLFGGGGGLGGGGGFLSGIGGLLGFQNGGSFMVGGSGGTDSQLVAFRATPNERVNVETPGQARMRDNQQPTVIQAPAPNVTVNVGGSQIASALNDNGAGDDFVVNALERNQPTVRQIAGT